MDKLTKIEKTAMGLVHDAGRYGAYLSHLGFEVAGVADWIETQIPKIRVALEAMALAAGEELARPTIIQTGDRER